MYFFFTTSTTILYMLTYVRTRNVGSIGKEQGGVMILFYMTQMRTDEFFIKYFVYH